MPCTKESLNQLHHQWTRRNGKCIASPHPRQHTQQCLLKFWLTPKPYKGCLHLEIQRGVTEFLRCLIRLALIRWYWDQDVCILNHKSITLCVFIHLRSKRAEAITLLDSGATENFISISYARKLGLPIWRLTHERRLFNVNGTPNWAGTLKYYVDMSMKTGGKKTYLCYFLTDLGKNHIILRYPWFAGVQPKIDWAKGWINYAQLPIIVWSDNADKAIFATWTKGRRAVIRRV